MAWSSTSGRTRPLPPNWQALRVRVLARDGHRCQATHSTGALCGERANHVDHVRPASQGGGDEPGNLRALCAWHHGQKTAQEGAAARRARPRPTKAREPEPHPLTRRRREDSPPPGAWGT